MAWLIPAGRLGAQGVPEHLSYQEIYEFVDELANDGIIEMSTAVKPYGRQLIADKLFEAQRSADRLSARQRAALRFYLDAYRLELGGNAHASGDIDLYRAADRFSISLAPAGIFYRDSLFGFAAKPVLGVQYWSNGNDQAYHRWSGIEGYGIVGREWGFYASLRDNHESVTLTAPQYLNQRRGAPAKTAADGEGIDYSESRGGLVYSWTWGSVGLQKEHFAWGNGYNGPVIFSGRTPSPGFISLKLTPVWWFEFNYVHAWLVSEVIDSSRSYTSSSGTQRDVYHDKYVAANLFTFRPFRKLDISIGNSIVYSDIGVQAAYLVPFLFYKSADHTLNGAHNKTGQNSQMFLDISSRQIRHLHLYASLFIDEFNTRRVTDGSGENNPFALKAGTRVSNLPLDGLALTVEYTMAYPITYKHNIETITFESNRYSLGGYLRDNSRELYLALDWRPLRGLWLRGEYTRAERGPDYPYGDGTEAVKQPYMSEVRWQSTAAALSASYEVIPNGSVFARLLLDDVSGADASLYTPAMFLGKTTTISVGAHVGY